MGLLKGRNNSSRLRIDGWRAKEERGERRGTARQGASLSRKLSQDGAKGT